MIDSASYILIPRDSAGSLAGTFLMFCFTLILFLQSRKTRSDRLIREIIFIQLSIIIHLLGYTVYSWARSVPQVLFWTRVNYTGALLIPLSVALFSFRLKDGPALLKRVLFAVILLLLATLWIRGDHYFISALNPEKTHSSLIKGDFFSDFLIADLLISAFLTIRTGIIVYSRKEMKQYRPLLIGLAGSFLILGFYGIFSAMLSLLRTQSWISMFFSGACLNWFGQNLVKEDMREKERLEEEMSRYLDDLIHDDLTGVYTRDYILESLSHCISQLRRNFRLYALVYIDLDDMKAINDEAGHEKGDELLKILGRVLLEETRESDIPARIGGDEFLLLMDDCPPEKALEAAEGIRDRFLAKGGEALSEWGYGRRATLSMGILCSRHWEGDQESIINRADEAMYASKKAGKNRITLYTKD